MKYDDLFIRDKFSERLSKQELLVLFNRMKQGDMKAREEFINNNIGLVINIVINNFMNVDYDKKELVSVGCVGLIKAVDTYDISKSVEFSSYAGKCITNEINMFLRMWKKNSKVSSFDVSVYSDGYGDDIRLKDVIPSEADIERDYVENEYNNYELQLLQQSMECLSERNRKIVMLYFGFFDGNVYTQQQISDILNISRSNVSRILNCSLKKIKIYMQLLEDGMNAKEINDKLKSSGNVMRKLRTIYEYFGNYTREEINEMIEKISDDDRELLRLMYGEDLDKPISIINNEQKARFNDYLVSKMKRLLKRTRYNKCNALKNK